MARRIDSEVEVEIHDSKNSGEINKGRIVLHHLLTSRSDRILWLLEELGVPYELKAHKRLPERDDPTGFERIHPLGLVPILEDWDENKKIVLAESGVIIEYLLQKYGNGRFQVQFPSTLFCASTLDNLYFSTYAEGTLAPLMWNINIFNVIPLGMPQEERSVASMVLDGIAKNVFIPRIQMNVEFIEKHFLSNPSTSPWFARGEEPTSADFMMVYPLVAICTSMPKIVVGDRVKAFVKAVQERPAYIRAMEKVSKSISTPRL